MAQFSILILVYLILVFGFFLNTYGGLSVFGHCKCKSVYEIICCLFILILMLETDDFKIFYLRWHFYVYQTLLTFYQLLHIIRKLYLGLIHLIDLGSIWSSLIHLKVLLIHLLVPQLVPSLLWFKPKPASTSSSMSKYSDRISIFVWVLRIDLALLWSIPKLVYKSWFLSEYSD